MTSKGKPFGTYQGVIILRMFENNKKKLEEFHEDYCNHRLIGRDRRITEHDRKIVADWKNGMTTRELSQKYKMTQSKIDSRISAVARYDLRNS